MAQRFGSKRNLLLALVRHSVATAGDRFPDAATCALRPLEGLVDALTAMTSGLSVEALANHLSFLQLDLSDPQFRTLAREHTGAVRNQIRACLDAAVTLGQLPAAQDTERLSRSVQVAYNGALLTWALEPDGPVEEFVRDEIGSVLSAAGAMAP